MLGASLLHRWAVEPAILVRKVESACGEFGGVFPAGHEHLTVQKRDRGSERPRTGKWRGLLEHTQGEIHDLDRVEDGGADTSARYQHAAIVEQSGGVLDPSRAETKRQGHDGPGSRVEYFQEVGGAGFGSTCGEQHPSIGKEAGCVSPSSLSGGPD